MIMILNWVLPIVYVGYTVWRQWQPRLIETTYKLDGLVLAIGLINCRDGYPNRLGESECCRLVNCGFDSSGINWRAVDCTNAV